MTRRAAKPTPAYRSCVGTSGWNRAHFSAIKSASPPVPETCSMLAPTPASPESAGMSTAALNRIEDHLKQRYIDAGRFPGTQLMVYRRGKIVHSASQGFADLERKAPVKDDTIFRIYSMTKPITTVAFMMLVEEGRVALDEPVHKYIPEWKNLGVFVGRHRAGLPDPAAGAADADRRPVAAHVGPDLWLPAALQCRCRLPREEDRRGRQVRHARHDDRRPCEDAAGVFAGRSLELFGRDRRDRLPRREDLRQAVRAVSEGAHLQSARHERHRFPRARRQGASLRGVLLG